MPNTGPAFTHIRRFSDKEQAHRLMRAKRDPRPKVKSLAALLFSIEREEIPGAVQPHDYIAPIYLRLAKSLLDNRNNHTALMNELEKTKDWS